MSWKGKRDNTIRLAEVKYYKFTLVEEEYYYKQKGYLTYCDGWYEIQEIVKKTWKSALKRGNECIEMDLVEDLLEIENKYLLEVLNKKYTESNLEKFYKAIKKAKEKVREINKTEVVTRQEKFDRFIEEMEENLKK